jgi:hypothetical protein
LGIGNRSPKLENAPDDSESFQQFYPSFSPIEGDFSNLKAISVDQNIISESYPELILNYP